MSKKNKDKAKNKDAVADHPRVKLQIALDTYRAKEQKAFAKLSAKIAKLLSKSTKTEKRVKPEKPTLLGHDLFTDKVGKKRKVSVRQRGARGA